MLVIRVFQFGKVHPKSKQMIRAKSRIEVAKMDEAVNQKSRAYQQNERGCDLGDDQRTAQAPPAPPADGIASAFLEGFVKIEMRRLSRGRQSKNKSGNNRDTKRKQQHLRIDRDGIGVYYVRWNEAGEGVQTEITKSQTSDTAKERKQDTFNQ